MRVGVITEGDGEYASLPTFLRREFPTHELCAFVKRNVEPTMPIERLAAALEDPLTIVDSEEVDLILILLDRETVDQCPGARAAALHAEIGKRFALRAQVAVVLKNAKFENWLISDIVAIGSFPKRFRLSNATVNRVRANADNCDAHALLRASCCGDYHKVNDAMRIMARATARGIAAHSRSFRRLCRLLGHPAEYQTQSRLPAAPVG